MSQTSTLVLLMTMGLTLRVEGDTLMVSPRNKVIPFAANLIRANKPVLIGLLLAEADGCWPRRTAVALPGSSQEAND